MMTKIPMMVVAQDTPDEHYVAVDDSGASSSTSTSTGMICVAYESGVGTGSKSVKNSYYHRGMNPYKPGPEEHETWFHGPDGGG